MTRPLQRAVAVTRIRSEAAAAIEQAKLLAFSERSANLDPVHFTAPPTAEAWASVLSDTSQHWYGLLDDEDELVGLVVFSRITGPPWRTAEVGFALEASCVGRGLLQLGLGPLLCHHLGSDLRRIEARVEPSNERAARALAQLGFRFEGRARACLDGHAGRIDQDQWAIVSGDTIGIGEGGSGRG